MSMAEEFRNIATGAAGDIAVLKFEEIKEACRQAAKQGRYRYLARPEVAELPLGLVEWIEKSLRENGFYVERRYPLSLRIRWDRSPEEETEPEKEKEKNNE